MSDASVNTSGHPSEPESPVAARAPRVRGNYAVTDERRTRAEGVELIKPGNLFHWVIGLVECWVFSRRYIRLFFGIPFLAALFGGIGYLWWLKHSPEAGVLVRYEDAAAAAAAAGDKVRQENYLTALVNLRPRDPSYRFQLGQFLVSIGRKDGLAHILQLAPDNTDGYAPARMWLALQDAMPEPILDLTEDQVEAQLLRVVQQYPDHADAHRMLAESYVRKSEFKLAEEHLEKAARTNPELNIAIARLKKQLGRPPADVQHYAQLSINYLMNRLAANRTDTDARISLAEVRLMLKQETDARELLVSGLVTQDDPRLRKALSDFDLVTADQKLSQSILNRDFSRRIILNAMGTDPSNPLAIRFLARVRELGGSVVSSDVAPSLDYWQSQIKSQPEADEPRLVLSQLLGTIDQPAEAAEILRPVTERRPELRLTLARFLGAAGKTEEAALLINELLAESVKKLATPIGETDPTSAAEYAEILLAGLRSREAIEFLQGFPVIEGSRIPAHDALRALYGRASLGVYDSLIPPGKPISDETIADARTAPEIILELLADGINVPITHPHAIDRLARLTFSKHPAAASAENMIRQLRVAGDQGGVVQNLMGTHALQVGEYTRARTYLESANVLAKEQNPMILNNLAVALIRGEPSDPARALACANAALAILTNHPDVLSTRGEIYLAMNQPEDAKGDLEMALKDRRESVEVHELLVRVFTALGETDMAEAHRGEIRRLGGS